MADSTVIVQQLASVALFSCCFVAIIQGNISPIAVVGCASLCTVGAWVLWDRWMGLEEVHHVADGGFAAPSRYQQRLATAKSAVLIYAALLGLSPILKSLTRSTSSDSIWALSTWLLMMNVAFFDYGSSSGARYVVSILCLCLYMDIFR
jgi:phosphatidylinositol glycan class C protein